MGRARMLSESLATLETVLGVDLRKLSQNIAGNIAARSTEAEPSPAKTTTADR